MVSYEATSLCQNPAKALSYTHCLKDSKSAVNNPNHPSAEEGARRQRVLPVGDTMNIAGVAKNII